MKRTDEPVSPSLTARTLRYQTAWWAVLCLLALDYLSTLGYQPSLAYQAAVSQWAGAISTPWTTYELAVANQELLAVQQETGLFLKLSSAEKGLEASEAATVAEEDVEATETEAQDAFALGVERVAAYVNVGNAASDRVLERAGFTREGVVRSMPKPDGRRVDKTLFSLLPGE